MNLFASLMRTVVPIAVGLLLGLAAKAGFDIDSATVTTQVTALLTAVYYAVFRTVEQAAGKHGPVWLRTVAGVFLGYARPPEYPAASAARPRVESVTPSSDQL